MQEPMIDCVKMKHDIQAKIYEEIKGMSPAERIAYLRQAADGDSALARKFRRLKRTTGVQTATDRLGR